jgi:putative ABC transport system permease protein
MSPPWILARRHLRVHWARTGLTVAALVVALYLFCFLVSLVTTLDASVKSAASNRVITQSAVSLFVVLPLDYQPKIHAIPGVGEVTKFTWFGGYYQDRDNFLAEFAVDHEIFFDMYRPEIEIVEGPGGVTGPAARQAVIDAMKADRRACVVGAGLAADEDFRFAVGQTLPLIPTIYPKVDDSAWEFTIVGIYKPLKGNMDDRTMWFRHDYLTETLLAGEANGPHGVSTYAINLDPGADPGQVIDDIDALFANGPQRTMTTTEAAFQAAFVSMMGNLPFFVGTIGGAVVFAVMFSVVNTMLMSARQRTHEMGILKALGYSDGSLGLLLLGESLMLALMGGGLGVLLAHLTAELMRSGFGAYLPTYAVLPSTLLIGLAITMGIGLIAGIAPALAARRLAPTAALRSEG